MSRYIINYLEYESVPYKDANIKYEDALYMPCEKCGHKLWEHSYDTLYGIGVIRPSQCVSPNCTCDNFRLIDKDFKRISEGLNKREGSSNSNS